MDEGPRSYTRFELQIHDIKTCLTVIRLCAHLIAREQRRRADDRHSPDYTDALLAQLTKLDTLLTNLGPPGGDSKAKEPGRER